VNVPSDALTPRGQGFVLHESQALPWTDQAAFNTTNFLCFGLTDHTELCATVYGVDNDGSSASCLGLGFKSVYDILGDRWPDSELKLTYGGMLPISLSAQDERVGYFPYAHLSTNLGDTGWRGLAGVAAGSENLFGEAAVSVLAGLEYPLTKHWSFTGEWFSGHHELSGLIPGLTYHRGRWIVVAGYKIPNDFDHKGSAFILEGGLFFGPGSELDQKNTTTSPHYGIRVPH
jgi:hypothetical protein